MLPIKLLFFTHKRAEQLYDFDEHPVVGGGIQQLEEDILKTQVVVRILSGQLTNNIDCRTLDT
jgi:hypothetical protein